MIQILQALEENKGYIINPFLTSRLVHPYHLDESIPSFLVNVFIFNAFSIEIFVSNSVGPDQTVHLAASELDMHCFYNNQKGHMV